MTLPFDFTDQYSANIELLNQFFSLALFAFLLHLLYEFFFRFRLDLKTPSETQALLFFAGISTVSLVIFFWTMTDPSSYFLTLVISLILGVSVFHPSLALSSVCGLLILRAWEIRTDLPVLAILPRVVLLIFFVSFLLAGLRQRQFSFDASKIQIAILALGVWVLLSTVTSVKPVDSQAAFFEGYFKSLVIFFLIFQSVRQQRDYETLVGGLVVSVLGIAMLALFNTYFILHGPRLELRGAIKNSNDLAAVFIFILPFVVRSFWLKTGASWHRVRDAAIALILLAGIWKAQSRAAYLAIFCMGAIWCGYRLRKKKKALVAGILVASLGLAVLSGLQLGRDSSDLEGSRNNRLGYWKAGVAMALRNPLLGVGYGRFPFTYRNYGAAFTEYGQRTAHSSWILLVSEAGVPALALFLGIFTLAFRRAWQLAGVAPELLLSLTGYGVAMSFLSHVYTIYPYVLLALIFKYPQKKVVP